MTRTRGPQREGRGQKAKDDRETHVYKRSTVGCAGREPPHLYRRRQLTCEADGQDIGSVHSFPLSADHSPQAPSATVTEEFPPSFSILANPLLHSISAALRDITV
jgi:hypothetical protein